MGKRRRPSIEEEERGPNESSMSSPNKPIIKKRKKRQEEQEEEQEEEAEPKYSHQNESGKKKEKEKENENGGVPSSFQLVRLLRNHSTHLHRKIDSTWQYLEAENRQVNAVKERWVMSAHFFSFISDWIQSVLISSAKPNVPNPKSNSENGVPTYLDERCWCILKWCLLSKKLDKPGCLSTSLMRPIAKALTALCEKASLTKEFLLPFTDVICLLLFHHEQSFRPNLDMWMSTALASLELTQMLCKESSWSPCVEIECRLSFKLVTFIGKGFAKFVGSHPNPKKVFVGVTERLLDLLLTILVMLSVENSEAEGKSSLRQVKSRLLRAVEDILKHSLFHPSHIDGYLNVCSSLPQYLDSSSKPIVSDELEKLEKSNVRNSKKLGCVDFPAVSYHKRLFQQLKMLRSRGKTVTTSAYAWVLKIFLEESKKGTVWSSNNVFGLRGKRIAAGMAPLNTSFSVENSSIADETELNNKPPNNADGGTFRFFGELAGPLLKELKEYLEILNSEHRPMQKSEILQANSLIVGMHKLLIIARKERVYNPTEDTEAQLQLLFIREIYCTLVAFRQILFRFLLCLSDTSQYELQVEGKQTDGCIFLENDTRNLFFTFSKEVLCAIRAILELEYKVCEDLTGLWLLILSAVAFGFTLQNNSQDASKVQELTDEAVLLASGIMEIFSDLRQVDRPLFSLFTSLRILVQPEEAASLGDSVGEEVKRLTISSLPAKGFAKSVEFVVCSPLFSKKISGAMQYLPEGQATQLIGSLSQDLGETLRIFKDANRLPFKTHAMLVQSSGIALMELYTSLLSNLNVTHSNSIRIGSSVCNMLKSVIGPLLSMLVDACCDEDEDCFRSFWIRFTDCLSSEIDETFNIYLICSSVVLTLILRFYTSARSLNRQCITLMPPKSARKASIDVDDTVTMSFTSEFVQADVLLDCKSFFSYTERATVPVYDIVTKIEYYMKSKHANFAYLSYTLYSVTMASLFDLDLQIKAVKRFLDQAMLQSCSYKKEKEGGLDLLEEGVSLLQNFKAGSIKKMQSILEILRKNACSLAKFLLKGKLQKSIADESNMKSSDADVKGFEWSSDTLVSFINSETLDSAWWHLLCENIEMWCEYASEASLQKFARAVVRDKLDLICYQRSSSSLHCSGLKKKISNMLLGDTSFYEQKEVQGAVLSVVCEEVKEIISFLYKHISIGKTNNINLASSVEFQVGNIAGLKAISFVSLKLVKDHHEKTLSGISDESFHYAIRSVAIFELVSWLPKGYIDASNSAKLISLIITFERGLANLWIFVQVVASCCASCLYLKSRTCKSLDFHPSGGQLLCFMFISEEGIFFCHLSGHANLWIFVQVVASCCASCLYLKRVRMPQQVYFSVTLADMQIFGFSSKWWPAVVLHVYILRGLIVENLVENLDPDHAASNPNGFRLQMAEWLESLVMCHSYLVSCRLIVKILVDNLDPNLAASKPNVFWLRMAEWLQSLVTSRRVMESLILCKEESQDRIMRIIQESDAFTWMPMSIHALSTCIFSMHASSSSRSADYEKKHSLLMYFLRSTTAVLVSLSEHTLRESLNFLDVGTPNDNAFVSESKPSDDLLVVESLTSLNNRLGKVLNYTEKLQSFTTESIPDMDIFSRDLYGVLALVTEVSCILWGITTNLKLLDDKCHSDKTGCSKWSSRLPNFLSTFVLDTESVLVSCFDLLLLGNSESRFVNSTDLVVDGGYNHEKAIGKQNGWNSKFEKDMEVEWGKDDGKEAKHNSGEKGDSKRKIEVMNDMEEGSSGLEISDTQLWMLESMLEGNLREQRLLLGEIFTSLAAIVRLRSLFPSPNVFKQEFAFDCVWTSSLGLQSSVICRLMFEAAKILPGRQTMCIGWLLGAMKYMESIGCFLPCIKPSVSSEVFVRLIDVHIAMLGAIIPADEIHDEKIAEGCDSSLSLSNACQQLCSDNSCAFNCKCIEEMRRALRSSFTNFMRKPLRLHLRPALQSIERALLGFEGGQSINVFEADYPASMKVRRVVAAGVECLSMCLDAISGPKRLKLLAKYCSKYLTAILQLLSIFRGSWFVCTKDEPGLVDAIPVILKCVNIVIKVSSRDAIFPMKPHHISQAMSCPAILFKQFYHYRLSESRSLQSVSAVLELPVQAVHAVPPSHGLVKVYSLCCKLLGGLLRHRKRESGHAIALLQESVRALLFFLETTDVSLSIRQNGNYLSIEAAIQCASWLRRLYEEIAEDKDVLAKYCSHILCDYICVISGYGLTDNGLERQVNETLRPGAYALVDMCSTDDLQQLHAVLGEGPRRSALQELRHDYEQHFKYVGKV